MPIPLDGKGVRFTEEVLRKITDEGWMGYYGIAEDSDRQGVYYIILAIPYSSHEATRNTDFYRALEELHEEQGGREDYHYFP